MDTLEYEHPAVGKYLERNVFIAQPDFQLLSTILVLLRPLRIIFPIGWKRRLAAYDSALLYGDIILHDFALLDDTLDFLNHR